MIQPWAGFARLNLFLMRLPKPFHFLGILAIFLVFLREDGALSTAVADWSFIALLSMLMCCMLVLMGC